MAYEIIYFEKSNGRKPVWDFLDDLGKKNQRLRASVLRDMALLRQFGRSLKFPDVRSMGDGLYELRSQAGSDIARVFYFFFDGRKIVVTNGFVKKTPKTPTRELTKAIRYKKEYEETHG
ncbi:MAG: type II toxin-antitoxin system RelE/ParE family toxin [Planctomycetia bacterium]|nr:type II toxin-antitoxin system RelE/ParE family toxin [Planctomycetia bacterium]